jgi:hypothetical protein
MTSAQGSPQRRVRYCDVLLNGTLFSTDVYRAETLSNYYIFARLKLHIVKYVRFKLWATMQNEQSMKLMDLKHLRNYLRALTRGLVRSDIPNKIDIDIG